jgi:hypothetical protein
MLEYPPSLHPILLPVTLVTVPVRPLHLPKFVIRPLLEPAFIHQLSRNAQLPLPLLSVPVPVALSEAINT